MLNVSLAIVSFEFWLFCDELLKLTKSVLHKFRHGHEGGNQTRANRP